jgi:DNA-damage-inducible protein J
MMNTTIQIRTDTEVKEAADSIFNRLGITMSDGINIFLRQVRLYQGFPFPVTLSGGPVNDEDFSSRK